MHKNIFFSKIHEKITFSHKNWDERLKFLGSFWTSRILVYKNLYILAQLLTWQIWEMIFLDFKR